MGDSYFVASRGCAKPYTTYFVGLRKLYEDRKISWTEYICMVAAAKAIIFNESENEVMAWAEEQIAKGGPGTT